jgi:hypothetical protein
MTASRDCTRPLYASAKSLLFCSLLKFPVKKDHLQMGMHLLQKNQLHETTRKLRESSYLHNGASSCNPERTTRVQEDGRLNESLGILGLIESFCATG